MSKEKKKPKRIGNYQLGDALGKGAFGTVYKGLDLETGRMVAVKRLELLDMPKDELENVRRELMLLKKLDHENIIKLYEAIASAKRMDLVLEFAEGGSLEHMLKGYGPMAEKLIARYLQSTLEALVYLHAEGVVHRDIKAGNILMTKSGGIKLADFGISITMEMNQDGKVLGSPFWMAPEVIEMEPATSAADIWSLGCTVIELLTGAPPYFDLAPMTAMFRMVENESPPLPDGISTELKDFLNICFLRDAKKRPTAADLLQHAFIQRHVEQQADAPDYYSSKTPSKAKATTATTTTTTTTTSVSSGKEPPSARPVLERMDTVQSVQSLLKSARADGKISSRGPVGGKQIESKLNHLVKLKRKAEGFEKALQLARQRLAKAEAEFVKLQDTIKGTRSELRSLCCDFAERTGVSTDQLWQEQQQQIANRTASLGPKSAEHLVQQILAPDRQHDSKKSSTTTTSSSPKASKARSKIPGNLKTRTRALSDAAPVDLRSTSPAKLFAPVAAAVVATPVPVSISTSPSASPASQSPPPSHTRAPKRGHRRTRSTGHSLAGNEKDLISSSAPAAAGSTTPVKKRKKKKKK